MFKISNMQLKILLLIDQFFLIMQDKYVTEQSGISQNGPLVMNAFEMITLSQGLNLSALFDRRQVH